jgi:DNA-binding MarR family transcriptional regulator
MNHRLVSTCVKILCSLSPVGMNVNNIIKQTSSDRTHVVQAINTLRKGKLVMKERSKIHSQMIIVKPTVIGNEVISVVNKITQYNESYSKFVLIMNEKFERYMNDYFAVSNIIAPADRRILVDKLAYDGWKTEEIKCFERWIQATFEIESILRRQIFHALIYRFLTLSYKFSINLITREIVTHLLLEELRNQVSVMIGGIGPKLSDVISAKKKEAILSGLFSDFHESVLSDVSGLYGGYFKLRDCSFMNKEIFNLIFSLLDLFNVGKGDLRDGILLVMSDTIEDFLNIHTSEKFAGKISMKDFKDRDILRGIFQKLLDLKSV